MLRHIVLWTFKDHAEGGDKAANIARAHALLQGCAALTPGILQFKVATAQPGLIFNADLVLDSTFTDRAALDAYQHHPEHVAIKPFMAAAVAGRHCVDFET